MSYVLPHWAPASLHIFEVVRESTHSHILLLWQVSGLVHVPHGRSSPQPSVTLPHWATPHSDAVEVGSSHSQLLPTHMSKPEHVPQEGMSAPQACLTDPHSAPSSLHTRASPLKSLHGTQALTSQISRGMLHVSRQVRTVPQLSVTVAVIV